MDSDKRTKDADLHELERYDIEIAKSISDSFMEFSSSASNLIPFSL